MSVGYILYNHRRDQYLSNKLDSIRWIQLGDHNLYTVYDDEYLTALDDKVVMDKFISIRNILGVILNDCHWVGYRYDKNPCPVSGMYIRPDFTNVIEVV